jgi:hypothetical protein
MKLFGSLKELVSAVFRKDSQEITLRPSQTTTYTAARDVQLPPGDTAHTLVSATSTQTLTNKTIDGDDNTVQDLPITVLKTVLADANKPLVRDGSGVPTSALLVNANIDAAAAIAATKLADGSVDNTEFQRLGTAGTNASGELVTTDGTQLLQNKTIDGDENTVQDLPLTAIKTAIADADKVIRRDASGVIQSGNTIPNTSALVTTDATQTLTGKTISGASNTLTVLAGSQLSGATPIANGGTGQTTQTAGFNALSPLTTKGDIIVHNGTDSIRLPIGSDGQVIVADSVSAAGLKWAANTATTLDHSVLTHSPTGYGSTDNRIRIYSSATTRGTSITYATSATDGDTFTINDTGLYTISMMEFGTVANATFGISNNGLGNADITSLANSNEQLAITFMPTASYPCSISVTVRLVAGDVIRAHVDGAGAGRPNGTGPMSQFRIVRIG